MGKATPTKSKSNRNKRRTSKVSSSRRSKRQRTKTTKKSSKPRRRSHKDTIKQKGFPKSRSRLLRLSKKTAGYEISMIDPMENVFANVITYNVCNIWFG